MISRSWITAWNPMLAGFIPPPWFRGLFYVGRADNNTKLGVEHGWPRYRCGSNIITHEVVGSKQGLGEQS